MNRFRVRLAPGSLRDRLLRNLNSEHRKFLGAPVKHAEAFNVILRRSQVLPRPMRNVVAARANELRAQLPAAAPAFRPVAQQPASQPAPVQLLRAAYQGNRVNRNRVARALQMAASLPPANRNRVQALANQLEADWRVQQMACQMPSPPRRRPPPRETSNQKLARIAMLAQAVKVQRQLRRAPTPPRM